MGTQLHHILKSLCLGTDWKYAVFWKLKHRTRMVLTWEDAYYNYHQHASSENKFAGNAAERLHEGHYSHDPLGLAVAKMSYHVYSLGEGIVGQVAVSGQHQWIFADKHAFYPCSSFESSDGWQSQFSAGIRTVVVVAVVPRGVIQLGSLYKVAEDIKLVTHVRDLFHAIQDSPTDRIPSTLQCLKSSLCLPKLSTDCLASERVSDYLCNSSQALTREGQNVWFPLIQMEKINDDSFAFPRHGIHPDMAVEVVDVREQLGLLKPNIDESNQLLQGRSSSINPDNQNRVQLEELDDQRSKAETVEPMDMEVGSTPNATSSQTSSQTSATDHANSYNATHPVGDDGLGEACFSSDLFDLSLCSGTKLESVDFYQNKKLCLHETTDIKYRKDLDIKFETELSNTTSSHTSLKFSAVSELHEALGPAFLKKTTFNGWGEDKIEYGTSVEMPEGMDSSQLTFDSGPDNLLEAVVANFCHADDTESEKSFCQSVQPPFINEKLPASSYTKHAFNSSGYSINQPSFSEGKKNCCLSSSEISGVMSSRGLSSACPSTCSEQFDRCSGPAKNSKKRARPGESGRPRPRDRQLIQDRIKELRELVPNGSKCSIDSLLERTIKHMLFLQGITQHAEKLKKCANSKTHCKESGVQESSSYEEGSSWAVEVGSHLKVCSIMVENLDKNGQMLVEMLCEECSHFLEIAETIRSLGLTILKGITEGRGEKTWICFIVEGKNNRSIHRMDILWSLVQTLQSKTSS